MPRRVTELVLSVLEIRIFPSSIPIGVKSDEASEHGENRQGENRSKSVSFHGCIRSGLRQKPDIEGGSINRRDNVES